MVSISFDPNQCDWGLRVWNVWGLSQYASSRLGLELKRVLGLYPKYDLFKDLLLHYTNEASDCLVSPLGIAERRVRVYSSLALL